MKVVLRKLILVKVENGSRKNVASESNAKQTKISESSGKKSGTKKSSAN